MSTPNPEATANLQTRRLIDQFRKCQFAGATPQEYLGRGASSLVFACEHEGQPAALKIFDPGFLDENPGAIEQERIRRQLELRAHPHPHLVSIHDAGYCDEAQAHFLLMQRCSGKVLTSAIDSFPVEQIRPIISQIASAARHLDNLNHVHRDIKPDNIIIADDLSSATLLDLGVVLPLDISGVQEGTDTLEFVGTPRYSPPEFLLRREDGTNDGWRAITFYQLGAVLHDLIMRRPLFHDQNPKGRLYWSIFYDSPLVESEEVPADLVALARLCLRKQPQERLNAVTWEMFDGAHQAPTRDQLRERIRANRSNVNRPRTQSAPMLNSSALEKLANSVKDGLIADSEVFPAHHYSIRVSDVSIVFSFSPSAAHGLDETLHVILWPQFDEHRRIASIAGCAGIGQLAPSLLSERRKDAAVVPVMSAAAAAMVGVQICTASILASSEGAGVNRNDMILFDLGHYL